MPINQQDDPRTNSCHHSSRSVCFGLRINGQQHNFKSQTIYQQRTRVCANHRMIYDAIQRHSMIGRPVRHSCVVDGVRNREKRQRDHTRTMLYHRPFSDSTTETTKKFARRPSRHDDDVVESNGGSKSPPPMPSKRIAKGHLTSWFLGLAR
jgi:hypothetical protein